MCPSMKDQRAQGGYLMPLAAFILVAMGLMAITLMRTTGQNAVSVTQEGITLQAFYAAETGGQLGMHNLFYDSATALVRSAIDARCDSMNIARNLSATGLGNCSLAVSCSRNTTGATSFYTITSVGNCGSGETASTRTVEVSAFFE